VRNAETDIPTQIQIVMDKLRSIWQQCNSALPLLEKLSLRRKLVLFLDKVKSFDGKRLKRAQKKHLLAVKDQLFDIAACSCQLPALPCKSKLVECNAAEGTCDKKHIFCECVPEKQVPLVAREYLLQQRSRTGTYRSRFQFGHVDQAAIRKKAKRQQPGESHAKLMHTGTSRLAENIQLDMSFGSEVKSCYKALCVRR
jgi:hypothetical protein